MNQHIRQSCNHRLALKMLLIAILMFGFGFTLVPLYDVFCELTGLNGRSPAKNSLGTQFEVDTNRQVTVELVSNVNTNVPWQFQPNIHKLKVRPGQLYTASFSATNPTQHSKVIQAVSSIAPGQAARYFSKLECFCFSRQRFAPREKRELPLRFAIDPALPKKFGTLSLAYTLFDITEQASDRSASK